MRKYYNLRTPTLPEMVQITIVSVSFFFTRTLLRILNFYSTGHKKTGTATILNLNTQRHYFCYFNSFEYTLTVVNFLEDVIVAQ